MRNENTEKKKRFYCALGGFFLGALTASLMWMWAGQKPVAESSVKNQTECSADDLEERSGADILLGDEVPATENIGSSTAEPSAETWDSAAVYNGGDIISHQGRRYRAKWWTQGERPDSSDVWEDLGVLDGVPVRPEGTDNVPIDASTPPSTERTDFKVVGYYPSWKPDKLNAVDFGIVTHLCYAFAIPTADGGLRDLENPDTARTLIRSAHENGAKVLLSVGGWSYNDTPLENVFMEATADETKRQRFVDNILARCEEYGLMEWTWTGSTPGWTAPAPDSTRL